MSKVDIAYAVVLLEKQKLLRILVRFNSLKSEIQSLESSLAEKSIPRSAANRHKLRKLRSDCLVCFLAVLREIAGYGEELVKRKNSTLRSVDVLKSQLTVSEASAHCRTYATGGMFGQTAYDTPKELLNSIPLTLPVLTADRLAEIMEEVKSHNLSVEHMRTVAAWIVSERDSLLAWKAENSVQASLLSAILATIPESKWGRSQCTVNHFCGLHGGSLDKLRSLKVLPRDSGKRTNLGGSVNRARGRSFLSYCSGTYSKLERLRFVDSLGGKRTFDISNSWERQQRKQHIGTRFLRQAAEGIGPIRKQYAELLATMPPEILQTISFPESDGIASEGIAFQRYRAVIKLWELVKNWNTVPLAEPLERIRALSKLKHRMSLSLPGIDSQGIASRPEYCGELELVSPLAAEEFNSAANVISRCPDNVLRLKDSDDIGEAETVYSVPLYRCLTFSASGFSWEYFIGRCRVPERLQNAIRFAHGYHIVADPIEGETREEYWQRSPDIGIVRANLVRRISAELRQRWHSYRSQNSAQPTDSVRTWNCKVLRTLRATETISIADSTRTGNCEFGSKNFARLLGIESSAVPGSELAKRWKDSGYPQNSLFFRVVESLPAFAKFGGGK